VKCYLNPEDGHSTALRNIGIQPPHYTEQQTGFPLHVKIFLNCTALDSKLISTQKKQH